MKKITTTTLGLLLMAWVMGGCTTFEKLFDDPKGIKTSGELEKAYEEPKPTLPTLGGPSAEKETQAEGIRPTLPVSSPASGKPRKKAEDQFTGDPGPKLIEKDDELVVDLTGIPEADRYEFLIGADGNVSLPLIGQVYAMGKEAAQLRADIRNAYVPDFYRQVSVNVMIVPKIDFFFIDGYVNEPGQKRMEERTTLTQAIAQAGGVTEFAHKKKVYVKRGGQQYELDRQEILKDPSKDVEILPGDVIRVERTVY